MQRIYSKKTNERISQQKLEAANTGGLSDELLATFGGCLERLGATCD